MPLFVVVLGCSVYPFDVFCIPISLLLMILLHTDFGYTFSHFYLYRQNGLKVLRQKFQTTFSGSFARILFLENVIWHVKRATSLSLELQANIETHSGARVCKRDTCQKENLYINKDT